VRVWGITNGEDEETLSSYVQQLGLTFPVLLDRDGSVSAAYQQMSAFPSAAYPQDWIVDGEGTVVYMNNAFDVDAMEAALERALEE